MLRNPESSGHDERIKSRLPAVEKQNSGTSPGPLILWPRMPARGRFLPVAGNPEKPVDIHVWAGSLDLTDTARRTLSSTLAPAELRRADRFHFAEHRARFIAARGLLRTVLGRCLDTEPGSLEFQYAAHGKPQLAGRFVATGLQFNLTHRENLALLAVAQNARIGIDVERTRVMTDASDLVTRFFSPSESAAFHSLSAVQQPEAFFNLWTRKEAWLKATGLGISQYLAQVEVTFLLGTGAGLVCLPEWLTSDGPWSLRDLRPAEGFAAALSVEGEIGEVDCWRWETAGFGQSTELPL